MSKKDEELKNWDVTFVRYIGTVIVAHTKEEARTIAEKRKGDNEIVGVIVETDEEADEYAVE